MTDFSIAAEIIETLAGRPATAAETAKLAKRYEELLPHHLAEREGRVLPCVKEILEAVHSRSDIKSLLLTGNSRIGAEHKLRKYGLAHYFDFDSSAFCNCHLTRDEVASVALAAASSMELADSLSVFVIGDTPNDIRCGKLIGAYTVGVATGSYDVRQLQDCRPWWALERLPAADEFLAKLEL
jgi:phosphoglycolate phosphatase-like HAD superfamily hydrolase